MILTLNAKILQTFSSNCNIFKEIETLLTIDFYCYRWVGILNKLNSMEQPVLDTGTGKQLS
jgi:hypothetical protein